MEEFYKYTVYFECDRAPLEQKKKKKVEKYFSVRRRSGGGECGPLISEGRNVYSITFKHQKDQQEVLKRSKHTLELTGGHVVVTVRDCRGSSSSIPDFNPPAEKSTPGSSAASSSGQYEPQLDNLSDHMKEIQNKDKDFPPVSSPQVHPTLRNTLAMSLAQSGAGEKAGYLEADDELNKGYLSQHEDYLPVDEFSGSFYAESSSEEDLSSLGFGEGNTVVASYSLSDGLQLTVHQGDITSLYSDALVIYVNEYLEPCDEAAAALNQAGGADVERDINALVNHRGKIPVGEVVATTGGRLKWKKLFLAVGPGKEKNEGKEILLKQTVQQTLNFAEAMMIQSITLSFIGLDVHGLSVEVCSEAIATAVKEFAGQSGRSLNSIILIDGRRNVVKTMWEACDRIFLGVTNRDDTPTDDKYQMDAAELCTKGRFAAPGERVSVEIVLGTIETQQVDALVSPMFGTDPLSTRVGNILNEETGSQIASMFINAGGDDSFPGDTIILEDLYGLPSKAVLFLNLIPWQEDQKENAVEVLKLGVNNILTSCDTRGFQSVALPVLGAGIALCFPCSLVAEVLLEQVEAFKKNRTSITPLVVRVVIHPDDEEAIETFQIVKEFLLEKDLTGETQLQAQDQAPFRKRIVLLGKTGSGKSHLANTILGEAMFTANHSPNSGTKVIQTETKSVNGNLLTLIDTPGFFDTVTSEEDLKPELMRCITECAPGPHAFLIVLKVEKYTKHEQEVVHKICQYFSEDALKYAVIVFTHGEQLVKMKIEDFVSLNEELRDLVKKCGGRCHVFDSKYWKNTQKNTYRSNQFHLEALLRTIDEMFRQNNDGYYTNEVLLTVGKKIQKQELEIRQSSKLVFPNQIRNQAKEMVWKEILIQLTGTATGIVLGAFLGWQNPSPITSIVKRVTGLAGNPALLAAGGELAVLASPRGIASLAATGGGIMGGITGFAAAKGAKTPIEAMQRASEAVYQKKKEFVP